MSQGIGKAWGKDFQERIAVERFKVHSVFNTVCNLQSSEDKPLLSLVTRAEAQGPNTLWVEGICFRTLAPGSILTWDHCNLLCGEVEVDCTALRPKATSLNVKGLKTVMLNQRPDALMSINLDHLKEVESWLELQFPGMSGFNPELEDNFVQSWDNQDLKLAISALQGLIGSGEGLTPAGDDLVAGLLLGLTRGETDKQNRYQAPLAGLLWNEARRTNAISRTMLWYAARGEGACYLTTVADDLLTASPKVFESAANLLRIGRTSGRYLLAGLIRGCKIFLAREHDHGRTDCG